MVTDTDPGNPVNADMWRAIGRLEGATAALLEGQREIKDDQREIKSSLHEQQQEMRSGLQEMRSTLHEQRQELRAGLEAVNQRVDRLFYTILAAGGGVIVAVIASRFIGG